MKTLEQISGNVNEVDCKSFWDLTLYQIAEKVDLELYNLFYK
jgi:hypothetical protein